MSVFRRVSGLGTNISIITHQLFIFKQNNSFLLISSNIFSRDTLVAENPFIMNNYTDIAGAYSITDLISTIIKSDLLIVSQERSFNIHYQTISKFQYLECFNFLNSKGLTPSYRLKYLERFLISVYPQTSEISVIDKFVSIRSCFTYLIRNVLISSRILRFKIN